MVIFVIKDIRNKKNINLYKLSKVTGLSRSYLRDLENNKKHNPTISSLSKIAIALNVSIKDLFYDKLEIDSLKNQLSKSVLETGLHSKQTMELSRIVDLLINIDWDKNYGIKK